MTTIKPLSVMARAARLFVFIVLTYGAAPVAAQPESAMGHRVRMTYAPWPGARTSTVIGRLARVASDTVAVDGASGNVSVPLHNVERLEISRGLKSQTGRGALIGMVGGGIVIASLARSSYGECTGWCVLSTTKAEETMIGAVIGGLGGAALGALIGAAIKVDRWEEVQLRPAVSMSATSPGLTLSLRL